MGSAVGRRAMKAHTLVLFLLLSSLFLTSLGKKLNKKDLKTLKLFKSLTKKAQSMQTTLVGLVSRLEAANQTANGQRSVSTRHTKGTDALTLVDVSFIGNQCGSFTLSSWSETINCYHATGRYIQTKLSFVQLLHYCALIGLGREL